jgi:transcriptional regulator with XRE-family HTH domain
MGAGIGAGQSRSIGIGDAASKVGVSPSTLRAWEAVGLHVAARGDRDHRSYSDDDIRDLLALRLQLREWNGTLREFKQVRDARSPDADADRDDEIALPERRLAQRLRSMRVRLRLSVREAARRAGLSPSFVSAVENGSSRPSVAALLKLAGAYGTNTLSFYDRSDDSRRKLVRSGARQQLRMGNPAIAVSLLTAHDSALEMHHFALEPGASSGGTYSHEGDEVWFVLQGELGVWVNDEFFRLNAGDSLSFASSDEHRFANLADGVTCWLGANTPSTF